ncbi:MAG: hypothetical protein LIQ30_10960 [Planctomycetes bacterium]|nr:hypothetical protein [Planctomycetota bacterium]MCD7895183.1 hypothetical protein [Planctomycetaceae bacterium]
MIINPVKAMNVQYGDMHGEAAGDIADHLGNSIHSAVKQMGFDPSEEPVGVSLSYGYDEGCVESASEISVEVRMLDKSKCPASSADEFNSFLRNNNGVLPVKIYHKTLNAIDVLKCFKSLSICMVRKTISANEFEVTDEIILD